MYPAAVQTRVTIPVPAEYWKECCKPRPRSYAKDKFTTQPVHHCEVKWLFFSLEEQKSAPAREEKSAPARHRPGKQKSAPASKKSAPAGNRTRVCTVAGYYSTTRPPVPYSVVSTIEMKILNAAISWNMNGT
jgi:hypothetical protein